MKKHAVEDQHAQGLERLEGALVLLQKGLKNTETDHKHVFYNPLFVATNKT